MPKALRSSLLGLLSVALLAAIPAVRAQDSKPVTAQPAPRDEGWVNYHKQLLERVKAKPIDLVFLGDSITQGWNDNETWKRFYGPRHAVNLGIGGDRTEHVLWRIENGEIDGISPKVVVLMIGTNNSWSNSPQEIAVGIKAIVETLRSKLPTTKVLLVGVFPRGDGKAPKEAETSDLYPKIGEINDIIKKLDDGKMVSYLDISPKFLNSEGKLSKSIMPDYLHLTPAGYRVWADAIEPTLWKLMEE